MNTPSVKEGRKAGDMTPGIATTFRAMGYRRRTEGVWMKPVAHMCFVFHESSMRWSNVFKGMTGQVHCWNSREFQPEEKAGPYLSQLKGFEFDTRTNVHAAASEFEFADLEDVVAGLMQDPEVPH